MSARGGPAPLVLLDPPAGPFWPLAATRPVASILAGTRSFQERWAARAGPVAALVCDAAVAGAAGAAAAGLPANAWPSPERGYRVALASWAPPRGIDFGDDPAQLCSQSAAAGWRLAPEQARALAAAPDLVAAHAALAAFGLPAREAGGRLIDSLWSLMAANPELVADDAPDFEGVGSVRGVDPSVILGDAGRIHVGADVAIGPFVVLDAREGAIVLGEGVRVEPHALLRGPLYMGPGTRVLGGSVTGSSFGPACRVRGEVEQSVFQGWANKAHDGFVGHSVFGRWVNLGAGTTTSDLKNTYGSVRVEGPAGAVETGLLKAGAFLGDHVKTGIGTLFSAGTRIGAASHVFGGTLAPRYLSAFSWHDGDARTPVRWEPFMRTAETVMARRDMRMDAAEREILAALHARSAGDAGGARR